MPLSERQTVSRHCIHSYLVAFMSDLGVLFLYVKTIERAHSPAHMWERIKLSSNYATALEQVRIDLVIYE